MRACCSTTPPFPAQAMRVRPCACPGLPHHVPIAGCPAEHAFLLHDPLAPAAPLNVRAAVGAAAGGAPGGNARACADPLLISLAPSATQSLIPLPRCSPCCFAAQLPCSAPGAGPANTHLPAWRIALAFDIYSGGTVSLFFCRPPASTGEVGAVYMLCCRRGWGVPLEQMGAAGAFVGRAASQHKALSCGCRPPHRRHACPPIIAAQEGTRTM